MTVDQLADLGSGVISRPSSGDQVSNCRRSQGLRTISVAAGITVPLVPLVSSIGSEANVGSARMISGLTSDARNSSWATSIALNPEDPGGPDLKSEICNGTALGTCKQGASCSGCKKCSDAERCAVQCTGGQTPDGKNYMSYYDWGCRDHFTEEQMRYMRCLHEPPKDDCVTRNGALTWSCRGPIDGMKCTQLNEEADPDGWDNNYLCSNTAGGIVTWSNHGPVENMRCTQITEPSEPEGHTWSDNYICVRKPPPGGLGSVYHFSWSYSGPLDGKECLRFYDASPWSGHVGQAKLDGNLH